MDPEILLHKFFGGEVDWQKRSGRYGYLESLYSDNMWFMHRKMDRGFECFIEMTGTGCRNYETLRGDDFDWIDLLGDIYNNYDYHFSRLDIALDVTEGWLPSMKCICGYVADRRYVSKFRRNIYTLGSEEFAFFGSPQSDVRLRIYNKALERGYDDQHWVRFEYQLRNAAAAKFVKEFLQRPNIGYCLRACLNNSIRFTRKPNNDKTHSSRLENVQWWNRLIDGACKMSLFEAPGIEYNLSRLEKYLVTQVAPSLAAYFKCKGGDLDVLYKLLDVGSARMNQNQSILVQQYQGDEI